MTLLQATFQALSNGMPAALRPVLAEIERLIREDERRRMVSALNVEAEEEADEQRRSLHRGIGRCGMSMHPFDTMTSSTDKPKLWCLGERYNDANAASGWEPKWRMHAVRCVLSQPAFTHGATRDRLVLMLGTEEFTVRNLLWPHHEPGAWDSKAAQEIALAILPHLPSNIVLLGRRVATAFRLNDLQFAESTSFHVQGVEKRFLCLPHPSGRSRALNYPSDVRRYQEAVRAWVSFP